jgi:hypothetical protein
MTDFERFIQKAGIAIIFTLLNYFIISNFIIELSFVRYFIVELVLVFSYKFYSFTISSLNLQNNNEQ